MFFCPAGNKACLNKCVMKITAQDAINYPTLKQAVNQYVCKNCLKVFQTKSMPNNTVYSKSENYIKKLFAAIFTPEDDNDSVAYQDDDITTNQQEIEENVSYNQDKLIDGFVGAIFANLAENEKIKFDENGKLSKETLKYFINEIEQNLKYPEFV